MSDTTRERGRERERERERASAVSTLSTVSPVNIGVSLVVVGPMCVCVGVLCVCVWRRETSDSGRTREKVSEVEKEHREKRTYRVETESSGAHCYFLSFVVFTQHYNGSDYRNEMENRLGAGWMHQLFECLVVVARANALIFARERSDDAAALSALDNVVRQEREFLIQTFGSVFAIPNAHNGLHYRDMADIFGLLRLMWTNRGEAKHLEFKKWIQRMNRWDIEGDMMEFEELASVQLVLQ
jgi:hypothetical protein